MSTQGDIWLKAPTLVRLDPSDHLFAPPTLAKSKPAPVTQTGKNTELPGNSWWFIVIAIIPAIIGGIFGVSNNIKTRNPRNRT